MALVYSIPLHCLVYSGHWPGLHKVCISLSQMDKITNGATRPFFRDGAPLASIDWLVLFYDFNDLNDSDHFNDSNDKVASRQPSRKLRTWADPGRTAPEY